MANTMIPVPLNSMMLPGQTVFPDTIPIEARNHAPVPTIPIQKQMPKSYFQRQGKASEAEEPKNKTVIMSEYPKILDI